VIMDEDGGKFKSALRGWFMQAHGDEPGQE
jgi:hypothetical protein